MQLQLNRKYRTSSGEIVTIVDRDEGPNWPFKGDNGEWYSDDGRGLTSYFEDKVLVSEVEEHPAVEAVQDLARQVKTLEEAAAQDHRNLEYYRSLLDEIGEAIGESAYIRDDGSRAKLPSLVRELVSASHTPCSVAIPEPNVVRTFEDNLGFKWRVLDTGEVQIWYKHDSTWGRSGYSIGELEREPGIRETTPAFLQPGAGYLSRDGRVVVVTGSDSGQKEWPFDVEYEDGGSHTARPDGTTSLIQDPGIMYGRDLVSRIPIPDPGTSPAPLPEGYVYLGPGPLPECVQWTCGLAFWSETRLTWIATSKVSGDSEYVYAARIASPAHFAFLKHHAAATR